MFSLFFAILRILSQLGNMHTFYQLGEKYEFFPLFSSPFNHYFSQFVMLGQKEKYTPLTQ